MTCPMTVCDYTTGRCPGCGAERPSREPQRCVSVSTMIEASPVIYGMQGVLGRERFDWRAMAAASTPRSIRAARKAKRR